ncbi:MAG: hypothetical protein E7295_09840 [Lachnospiraceae bacterium]|nr:hypothetical protein [Lachnospiraceae bacterium]
MQEKNCVINTIKPHLFSVLLAVFLLVSLSLSGCSQKEALPLDISSDDSLPGNPNSLTYEHKCPYAILRSDTGYYYNEGRTLSLHYYDLTTQKDIFLCNKPECKHDGNAYCVATNKKYTPLTFQYYDNAIFATAYCMDSKKLEFKLLRFAADGSSLSEVATYYSTNSANIDEIPLTDGFGDGRYGYHFLLIHRNKAFLPFSYHPEDNAEGEYVYGLMELDLDTREMKSVYEEIASTEVSPWYNVTARGDYIYYAQNETPHKHRLHRRSLLDDSDEVLQLVTNFTGCYAVMDDSHIAYVRSDWQQVYVHDLENGSNLSQDLYHKKMKYGLSDEEVEALASKDRAAVGMRKRDLYSDGTYLYMIVTLSRVSSYNSTTKKTTYSGQSEVCQVFIYDSDMTLLGFSIIPHPLVLLNRNPQEDDSPRSYQDFSLAFLGDQVYMNYKNDVFTCSMDDFLMWDYPDFEHVYTKKYVKEEDPFQN